MLIAIMVGALGLIFIMTVSVAKLDDIKASVTRVEREVEKLRKERDAHDES